MNIIKLNYCAVEDPDAATDLGLLTPLFACCACDNAFVALGSVLVIMATKRAQNKISVKSTGSLMNCANES